MEDKITIVTEATSHEKTGGTGASLVWALMSRKSFELDARSLVHELTLELTRMLQALAGQRSRLDRGLDGAARLTLVPAVAEAALLCQRIDVVEAGPGQVLVGVDPQRQLSHAGRVDQQPTTR